MQASLKKVHQCFVMFLFKNHLHSYSFFPNQPVFPQTKYFFLHVFLFFWSDHIVLNLDYFFSWQAINAKMPLMAFTQSHLLAYVCSLASIWSISSIFYTKKILFLSPSCELFLFSLSVFHIHLQYYCVYLLSFSHPISSYTIPLKPIEQPSPSSSFTFYKREKNYYSVLGSSWENDNQTEKMLFCLLAQLNSNYGRQGVVWFGFCVTALYFSSLKLNYSFSSYVQYI